MSKLVKNPLRKFLKGGNTPNINNLLIDWNKFSPSTFTFNYLQQTPMDYDTLLYEYIKNIENPDLIGYNAKTKIWTSPTLKGYDHNLIGIGLDTVTNKEVADYLRKNKRNWLYDSEMRQFQNNTFKYLEGVLNRRAKDLKLSDNKRIMAMGVLYRGDGPKLWNKNHPLSQAFFNGTDKDFSNAISNYYINNNLKERANRHNKFWKGKL